MQSISKKINLFAMGAHQSLKGVESRVSRLAYPTLHSEFSCSQVPDHRNPSSAAHL